MDILSSAGACLIWVLDYGVPGLFPLMGVAMIVMAVRNRPGAGQRLLPQRSHLPQVVFVVVIVPAQVWPAEGTDYWGYCVAITVCLAAVAHAVTTVRVLAARRRA